METVIYEAGDGVARLTSNRPLRERDEPVGDRGPDGFGWD
jgi:hypothetical protein